MSNETKRDVFENALREWDDLVHSCGLQGEEAQGRCEFDPILIKYTKDYDAALPDNLPVIPKEVGEYIRAKKRKNTSQSVYYLLRDTGVLWRRKKESKILSYMHDDPDTFARAWLLGIWRVEENGEIVKLEDVE